MATKARGSVHRRIQTRGLSVALTGASGKLGGVLLEALLADKGIQSVVVFDLKAPAATHAKLRFVPLDLTNTTADRVVCDALVQHKVEALAHLPILTHPDDPAYAHEVEAIGTIRVLAGLAASPVKRLVMVSTTAVYGALSTHPNHLAETRPLHAQPRSRYLADKVEMERHVASFRASHPDRVVTVLRFPPIVGDTVYDPFALYLARRFAPVVLGFDPLIQLVHVKDALQAIRAALADDLPGEFNVGSRGVLPLSQVLKMAGVRALPLPLWGTTSTLRLWNALGLTRTPVGLLDFVRYLCVADLGRAEAKGLGSEYTIHDALEALAQTRTADRAALD
jgi:UDP-glucose 4-epimerase